MAEWQPIETAPKDGTRFLAIVSFEPPHRYYGAGPREEIISWQDDPEGEGCWHLPPIGGEPTHWQPLPTPPTSPPQEPEVTPEMLDAGTEAYLAIVLGWQIDVERDPDAVVRAVYRAMRSKAPT